MHHIWVLHLMVISLRLAMQSPLVFQRSSVLKQKFWSHPLDLENVNGEPKLKQGHKYYTQVKELMGATGAKWCDVVLYTSKGMSIERVPFDEEYWNN